MIDQLTDTELLTTTEQAIAEYLLDYNHTISNLTSSSLGKLTHTSQSAVTRLYKKLGFTSYRSFLSQLVLEREQAQRYQYIEQDIPETSGTLTEIEAVLSSIYSKNMLETCKYMDENVFNRVCNRIMSSDNIDIYGSGISNTLAEQFCYKLNALGYNAKCFGGLNYPYVNSLKPNKNNVSILFTPSGRNTLIKELTHYLKMKNNYVVLISSNKIIKDQQISQFVYNDLLIFDTNVFEDLDGITFMFGAEYISNLIYATISHRLTLGNHL